jgi:pyridoxal phosphate enzyme (YggS family)
MAVEPSEARRQELAARLDQVRARISAACTHAGRAADAVTLTAITKTYPAADLTALAGLGVTDVGEARHPEARDKHAEVQADLVWHFVGALQTNKAAAVAAYCDIVESVDRLRLVTALERGAAASGRTLDALVQVKLDPDGDAGQIGARSGVHPDQLDELAAAVVASEHLRLRGLMAVAPVGADPSAAFARLASLHAHVRADHPTATVLSAGMSGDLEQAVRAGATHVRVGRALLGERPPLQ